MMGVSTVSYLLLLVAALSLQLNSASLTKLPPPPSPSPQQQYHAALSDSHLGYTTFLRFISNINNLNNNAGFIRRSLILDYNNQFPQLQHTFDEINIGIKAIKKSLIQNNLLVNSYQPTCPKPGTFNPTVIERYLSYTIQKEKIAVDMLMRTPQLIYLIPSAQQMYQTCKQYVSLVRSTMNGKFCNPLHQPGAHKPHPVMLVYKNNLVAGNWYYGSTNQARYVALLYSMYQKHNLTSCPLSKPFVRPNQNICFDCPPNSIYNLGTQNCDSCQPGYILDISQGQGQCNPCYGEIFLINHRFICEPCTVQSGQLFNPSTYTCYTCGLQYFLNATSLTCQLINCPTAAPRFNRQLFICQPCPSGLVIDTSDPSICVNPKLIGICPPSTPYFIDEWGKCSICPDGTIYNNVTHICQTGPAVNKISNTSTAVLAAKGKNFTTIITATNVVNSTRNNHSLKYTFNQTANQTANITAKNQTVNQTLNVTNHTLNLTNNTMNMANSTLNTSLNSSGLNLTRRNHTLVNTSNHTAALKHNMSAIHKQHTNSVNMTTANATANATVYTNSTVNITTNASSKPNRIATVNSNTTVNASTTNTTINASSTVNGTVNSSHLLDLHPDRVHMSVRRLHLLQRQSQNGLYR